MRETKDMFAGKIPANGRLKTSTKRPASAETQPAEKLTTRIASSIKTKLRLPSKIPSKNLPSASGLEKAVPLTSGGAMRLKASKIPRLAALSNNYSPRSDTSSSISTIPSDESPFSSPRSRIPVPQSSKTRLHRERHAPVEPYETTTNDVEPICEEERQTKIPKITDTRSRSHSAEKRTANGRKQTPLSARSDSTEAGLDDSWHSESNSSSLPILPKAKDALGGVKFSPQTAPDSPPDNQSVLRPAISINNGGHLSDSESDWESTAHDTQPPDTIVLAVKSKNIIESEEEEDEVEDIPMLNASSNLMPQEKSVASTWDSTPQDTPRQFQQNRDSDWDSTVPEATPRGDGAARDSDWDSSSMASDKGPGGDVGSSVLKAAVSLDTDDDSGEEQQLSAIEEESLRGLSGSEKGRSRQKSFSEKSDWDSSSAYSPRLPLDGPSAPVSVSAAAARTPTAMPDLAGQLSFGSGTPADRNEACGDRLSSGPKNGKAGNALECSGLGFDFSKVKEEEAEEDAMEEVKVRAQETKKPDGSSKGTERPQLSPKQSLEAPESSGVTGFHASHQKEAEQNRGSQSGYDSDSTINDNEPGRSQNDPVFTSPTGAYIHGVLGGPDHPDLVHARNRAAVTGTMPSAAGIVEDEDGLSYTSTEAEGGEASAALASELTDVRRQLERERELRSETESRRRLLEADKTELESRAEELQHERSRLETSKAELEARVQSSNFRLSEEEEKRKNIEKLLQTTRRQLKEKEEQYFEEQKQKQKAELDLRTVQMELTTLNANVQKLELERDTLDRALQAEQKARQAQEEVGKEQMRLQQALQEHVELESPLTTRSLEGSPLRRMRKTESIENLTTELVTTKTELDRVRTRFKDERQKWIGENEVLQSRIEELSKEIALNQDALTQASMQYSAQLQALRSENSSLTSSVEKERSGRRTKEEETKSLRQQLEALKLNSSRNDSQQLEEWAQRLNVREKELQELRDTNRSLRDKVNGAEARISAVELELRSSNNTLTERNSQLRAMRTELEQRRRECDELGESLCRVEDENDKLRQRLSDIEERNSALHQSLKALLHSFDSPNDFAPGVFERLSEIVRLIETDKFPANDFVAATEAAAVSAIRRSLHEAEGKAMRLDRELTAQREERVIAVEKLSAAESQLAVTLKAKTDLELENSQMKMEMESLRSRLTHSSVPDRAPDGASSAASLADAHLSALIDRIEKAETQSSQRAPSRAKPRRDGSEVEDVIETTDVQSAFAMRKDQDAEMHSLRRQAREMEKKHNAAESDEESSRSALQNALTESQGSKDRPESISMKQLNKRLDTVERENEGLKRKLEQERSDSGQKSEKLMDLSRKLRGQEDKNAVLEEELSVIKDKLRSAKARFKDFDESRGAGSSRMSDRDEAIADIRQQLEVLRSRLPAEKGSNEKNDDLHRDIAVIRSLEKAVSKLEKEKKKIEEEFYMYQMYVNANFVDRSTFDKWQAQVESRAQTEVSSKLAEVNRYLEETNRQREKLDLLRDESDQRMRKELDRVRSEGNEENDRLRHSVADLTLERDRLKDEVDKWKDHYDQERRIREKLADKVDRANDNRAAAQAQLSLERDQQRSMSAANLLLSSLPLSASQAALPTAAPMPAWPMPSPSPSPSLPAGSPFPTNGLRNSAASRLGGSQADLLSSRLRLELDRSIAKHMEAAPSMHLPSQRRKDHCRYYL